MFSSILNNFSLDSLNPHLIPGSILILLLAAFADFIIGDPWGWIHPVQVMGWLIKQYTALAIRFFNIGWQRQLAGILLCFLLISGSGLSSWLIIFYSSNVHELLGFSVTVILLASCFAAKSLRNAIDDVTQELEQGNLIQARKRLSSYVGRDTAHLSESEILRALLETLAENTVDGVTAPLFYGIIGSFTPWGAVPFAMAYKAASTLDSMVGYRREPYTDLGWFSAQLEDRLTWLPCRITVLTLSFFSGRVQEIWQICWRDGRKDPSPNSGWSEAAYAGILQVQLGGTNTYQGITTEKPLLGNATETISLAKIAQGLALTRYCFLTWLAIAILGHWQFR